MADPDAARTKKVSQSGIAEIQKLGMSAALKKYTAGGNSAEFNTAIERYYGKGHIKDASKAATSKATGSPNTTTKSEPKADPKPVKMPESAPAAAARASAPKKTTAEQALGKKNAATARKVTTPVGKVVSSMASNSKGISSSGSKSLKDLGKKFGINNPLKPRKR